MARICFADIACFRLSRDDANRSGERIALDAGDRQSGRHDAAHEARCRGFFECRRTPSEFGSLFCALSMWAYSTSPSRSERGRITNSKQGCSLHQTSTFSRVSSISCAFPAFRHNTLWIRPARRFPPPWSNRGLVCPAIS